MISPAMRLAAAGLTVAIAAAVSQRSEAPTGFDNRSNGVVDDSTHQADQRILCEQSPLYESVAFESRAKRDAAA